MSRISYVLLTSDQVGSFTGTEASEGPVYTREFLKGTLQLLGCKPRYAEKLSEIAFKKIETLLFGERKRKARLVWRMHPHGNGTFWVSIPRKDFNKVMQRCLESVYVCNTAVTEDWRIATRFLFLFFKNRDTMDLFSLREGKRGVTILLCGTSGTGKSTLASLLVKRSRNSVVCRMGCF